MHMGTERTDTERTEQLALLPDEALAGGRRAPWRLDDATRTRGRQGVAAARHALAEAAARRAAARPGHSQAA
jgi:hypothetical protein